MQVGWTGSAVSLVPPCLPLNTQTQSTRETIIPLVGEDGGWGGISSVPEKVAHRRPNYLFSAGKGSVPVQPLQSVAYVCACATALRVCAACVLLCVLCVLCVLCACQVRVCLRTGGRTNDTHTHKHPGSTNHISLAACGMQLKRRNVNGGISSVPEKVADRRPTGPCSATARLPMP